MVINEFKTAAKNAVNFGADKEKLIEIVEKMFKGG